MLSLGRDGGTYRALHSPSGAPNPQRTQGKGWQQFAEARRKTSRAARGVFYVK